jgi:hypothetical protein
MKVAKYSVAATVGESQDGPFRSYEMETYGDSLHELLDNVWITEVDQDGGDHGGRSLWELGEGATFRACIAAIERELLRVGASHGRELAERDFT